MTKKIPIIGITTDIKEDCFQIERKYPDAVARAGGIPILLPSIANDSGVLKHAVLRIDGLLVPGSRDMDPKYYNETPHAKIKPMDEHRTISEMIILESANKRNIPVLGICGGMQLINVFFGGSLYQDIGSLVPEASSHEGGNIHQINIEEETKLYKIIGIKTFSTKSHHHQSVKAIGNGLRVCAKSTDGIIEGIESIDSFILGVQWHPEVEESENSKRIFKAFIDQCRE
ncbi:MAG: gamma-glutamyl-gamma-aminobutyrate hydrolase family protein [Thermodesulfobacteriota bacterium]